MPHEQLAGAASRAADKVMSGEALEDVKEGLGGLGARVKGAVTSAAGWGLRASAFVRGGGLCCTALLSSHPVKPVGAVGWYAEGTDCS
jgi:hypothetical protein